MDVVYNGWSRSELLATNSFAVQRNMPRRSKSDFLQFKYGIGLEGMRIKVNGYTFKGSNSDILIF